MMVITPSWVNKKPATFPPQEPNFDDAAAVGLEQTAAETKRLKVHRQEEKGVVPESPSPKIIR